MLVQVCAVQFSSLNLLSKENAKDISESSKISLWANSPMENRSITL